MTGGNLLNYPDGDYQLSYQGTATVSFSGIGYLAGPVTTNRNGLSTGTVVIDHSLGNGQLLLMNVTGVSSTATMSNFHLYAPGYGSNPTQMFTNDFLNQLKPFSTIRFENWNNVINSKVSTWQQRTPSTSFVATGTFGVPYEDMIELANEAQKNLWINIPALATPNYVQNLAQLIDSELDPTLNVYVEYSDETWDPVWLEYTQVLQAAQSNPLVKAKGAANQVEQQSIYEIVSIAQIFDHVFGGQPHRSDLSLPPLPCSQPKRRLSSNLSRLITEPPANMSGAWPSRLISVSQMEMTFRASPWTSCSSISTNTSTHHTLTLSRPMKR